MFKCILLNVFPPVLSLRLQQRNWDVRIEHGQEQREAETGPEMHSGTQGHGCITTRRENRNSQHPATCACSPQKS